MAKETQNPKKTLTTAVCDRAEWDPKGPSNQFVWDDQIPGFGLRIYPPSEKTGEPGSKVFYFYYRSPVTKSKRAYRIGPHANGDGAGFPIKKAREKARELWLRVADGKDPREEDEREADKRREEAKRRQEEQVTVRQVMDTYVDHLKAAGKASAYEAERRTEKHIVPAFGDTAVAELTVADVAELHREIGKGAKREANAVIQHLRTAWNHAAKATVQLLPDGAPDNPAAAVLTENRYAEKSRSRFVHWESERPRLVEAVENEKDPEARAFLKLLFLGTRKNEILSARWENVDLTARILTLPETKSGRTHRVPLPPHAVEILEELPSRGESPLLFPSPVTGKARHDFRAPWNRVREAADLEDVTVHDLRRSVASWLVQGGTSKETVGLLLGHSTSRSVTDIYARLTGDEVRKPLEELWAKLWGSGEEEAAADTDDLEARFRELDPEEKRRLLALVADG